MSYIIPSDLAELGYKYDGSITPDLLQMCITASTMVDSYIQRVLPGKASLEANDVEECCSVRVRNGILKIFPKYYKVNSVESIVVSLNPFNNLEAQADNFKINNTEKVITARVMTTNGEYQATVKYNAGFGLDANSKSTLPVEVKKATMLIAQALISEFFMVKNFNISMLTQFKQGSLQFQRSSKLLNQAIPASAQLMLAEYRRTR